jgi:hypothetical protein
MSSDHKSGMTYAAQAFANQFGEVGVSPFYAALIVLRIRASAACTFSWWLKALIRM